MKNLIVVRKKELGEAFQRWNLDVIENPGKHEEPTGSSDDSKLQVEEIMGHITDGHIDEEFSEIRINAVSNFLDYCKMFMYICKKLIQ